MQYNNKYVTGFPYENTFLAQHSQRKVHTHWIVTNFGRQSMYPLDCCLYSLFVPPSGLMFTKGDNSILTKHYGRSEQGQV